mgnify:CR=1 FL=1
MGTRYSRKAASEVASCTAKGVIHRKDHARTPDHGVCATCDTQNAPQVALSEDHLNDVQSNVAAIVGAAVASSLPKFW